jgi:hypothetical protein
MSSMTGIPVTSTPNDTIDDLETPIFEDDNDTSDSNVRPKSDEQSNKANSSANLLNNVLTSIDPSLSFSSRKVTELGSISDSLPMNHYITTTLVKPRARRPDGTVPIVNSSIEHSSSATSSTSLPWLHRSFPRSLISSTKLKESNISKRQLPSLPTMSSSEETCSPSEQFERNDLYRLLDHLAANADRISTFEFGNMLDQLTLSTVVDLSSLSNNSDQSIVTVTSIDSDTNCHVNQNILPDLFDHSLSSAQDEHFYNRVIVSVNDPRMIRLYSMTISTVQLSRSIHRPYSILNGRRPQLNYSYETNFKPIASKRPNYTCRVTAIETAYHVDQLKPNDIILKVKFTVHIDKAQREHV